MQNHNLNLATLSRIFASEDEAREFLESKRWPDGVFCPRCGACKPYKLNLKHDASRPCRKGTYKCSDCRKRFTVRTGTVLEESRLPLTKWCMAFHLMTSSKKGISSRQLERELGVTPKTAWFLSMRIREAMKQETATMSGTIEADETYIGPRKPRYRGTSKPGRGTDKHPVIALVQRSGGVASKPVDRVTTENIRNFINGTVDKDNATLMTDELRVYTKIGREFSGGHGVVHHGRRTYVDGNKHCNTAESFFALVKRAHYGIHHHYSKTHTGRYITEREFVWNHRKESDGERMVAAIDGAEGKRLYYKHSIKSG